MKKEQITIVGKIDLKGKVIKEAFNYDYKIKTIAELICGKGKIYDYSQEQLCYASQNAVKEFTTIHDGGVYLNFTFIDNSKLSFPLK